MPDAARSLRVLIVDDSADAAESLGLLLELDGHLVKTAGDGPAALEIAAEFAPEAVLLDLGLPVMDGYEVARRLRALEVCRASYLVALTGYGRDEDRAAASAAGFDEHITKPADPNEIARLLARVHARRGPG
jgi:two-component system, OmpR family, response regulator